MRECVCATLQAPWVLPGHLFCAQQGPGTLLHPAEGSGARTGQSEKTHSKSLAPRLLSELQGHICETGQRLLRNPPPPALLGAPLELCALPYSGRPSPPRSLRLLQAHAPSADQGGVVTCVRPSAWQARSPREQHWQVAPRGRRSTGHILFLDLQASYLHAHLVRCVTWRFMIRAPVCSAFLCSSSGEPAARIGGGRGGHGTAWYRVCQAQPPLAFGHSVECWSGSTHCQGQCTSPSTRIWGSHMSQTYPRCSLFQVLRGFFPQENGKFSRTGQDDIFYFSPHCLPVALWRPGLQACYPSKLNVFSYVS